MQIFHLQDDEQRYMQDHCEKPKSFGEDKDLDVATQLGHPGRPGVMWGFLKAGCFTEL